VGREAAAKRLLPFAVSAIFLFTAVALPLPWAGADTAVYAADYEKWEDCDWDGYDDHTGVPVPWPGFDGTRGDTPDGAPGSQAGDGQEDDKGDKDDSSSGGGSSDGGSSDPGTDKKETEKKAEKKAEKKDTKKTTKKKTSEKKDSDKDGNDKKEDSDKDDTDKKDQEEARDKETEKPKAATPAATSDAATEGKTVTALNANTTPVSAAAVAVSPTAIGAPSESPGAPAISAAAVGTTGQDNNPPEGGSGSGSGGGADTADSLLKALTAGFSPDNNELPAGIAILAGLLASGLLALLINAVRQKKRLCPGVGARPLLR
jgi:hypothetical protein